MSTERLRVGDAERDAVVSALHEHFAQGRLTREELDERLGSALSARTVGDLRSVTRDLPGTSEAVARLFAPRAGGPVPGRAGRRVPPWAGGAPYGPPWAAGAGYRGWPPRGPRFGPPFGLILVAVAVAFFTGGHVLFPLIAAVWFSAVFFGFRRAQRRRRPLLPHR